MGWVCRRGELLLGLVGEGLARSLWWLPVSSGCTARGWGATGRGLGVLGVGGAFVQYAQPLASRSRPSWSRPTQADSGRSRRRTMTSGTLRRRRSGSGAGGPVTEAPGSAARTPDSLLRGPVSTALTSTSQPPKRPVGIVGILRFLPDARRRCACDISTMDTSDLPGPARPLPSAHRRLQDHRPAPGSRPNERLRSHDTHMSQN